MSAVLTERLSEHLTNVRRRIADACDKARRDVREVRLIAVTKSAELDWIRGLIELGQIDLAENRPQQLAQRAVVLPQSVRWHFIGHLQRNKIDQVLPIAECIHSVDSLRLLLAICQQSAKAGRTPRVLLEVNISGEASKGGFSPAELCSAWGQISSLDAVAVAGLMTMAPLSDNPETARPVFRGLRALRDQLVIRCDGELTLPELSMGMSNDFDIAVEEGATMVRIGTRLFEGLQGIAD